LPVLEALTGRGGSGSGSTCIDVEGREMTLLDIMDRIRLPEVGVDKRRVRASLFDLCAEFDSISCEHVVLDGAMGRETTLADMNRLILSILLGVVGVLGKACSSCNMGEVGGVFSM
jgi:hypothetical protein